MLRLATAVAIAALGLSACGGGGDASSAARSTTASPAHKQLSEAAREAEARKHVPGKRLSPADRVAYYQIATTAGLLRAHAAALLARAKPATTEATLAAGRARLDRVRPDSADLRRLRDTLEQAIDSLSGDQSKAGALSALKRTTAIIAQLTRFSQGKAVSLLVPD